LTEKRSSGLTALEMPILCAGTNCEKPLPYLVRSPRVPSHPRPRGRRRSVEKSSSGAINAPALWTRGPRPGRRIPCPSTIYAALNAGDEAPSRERQSAPRDETPPPRQRPILGALARPPALRDARHPACIAKLCQACALMVRSPRALQRYNLHPSIARNLEGAASCRAASCNGSQKTYAPFRADQLDVIPFRRPIKTSDCPAGRRWCRCPPCRIPVPCRAAPRTHDTTAAAPPSPRTCCKPMRECFGANYL